MKTVYLQYLSLAIPSNPTREGNNSAEKITFNLLRKLPKMNG
jgi:hypothetical protein